MAEIQKAPIGPSQLAQRFIEFVMLQAQQASIFLGKIPHPTTGKTEQNLEAARIFIDQLEMLQEKTRGNLCTEESEILGHILSDLRFGYVEATAASVPRQESKIEESHQSSTEKQEKTTDGEMESENKKKFSKNYGS